MAPTITPSVLLRLDWRISKPELGIQVCHYFLKGGIIEYLNDCTHVLMGCKVQLPPLPEQFRDVCNLP